MILVTGAGGYGASHVVRRLVAAGERVRAADVRCPAPGDAAFVDGAAYVACDITRPAEVLAAARGCRAVLHLAALVPFNLSAAHSRARLQAVNVEGTRNVVAACLAAGVRSLVFASSTGVVFRGLDIAGGRETDEDGAIAAASLNDAYSESKALAERAVLAASTPAANGLACVALRPNGIWGPGEQHHTPKLLLMARLGLAPVMGVTPDALTDFTHRDNLALAFELALARLENPLSRASVAGKAFFVGDGWPVHTLEFFGVLLTLLGFAAPFPSIIVPRGTGGRSECARLPRDEFDRVAALVQQDCKQQVRAESARPRLPLRRARAASASRTAQSRQPTTAMDEIVLTSTPSFSLPAFALEPFALVLELLALLVSPLMSVEPFLTRADVRKVVRHNYYSSDRAARLLGYSPVMSPAVGLREAAAYYRAQGFRGDVGRVGWLPWIVSPIGIALVGAVGANAAGVLDFAAVALRAVGAPPGLCSAPQLQLATRSVFLAAVATHVAEAAVVFCLAWPRNLSAGAWAAQTFVVGFPSTMLFAESAGLPYAASSVRAACVCGFLVLCTLAWGLVT